MRQNLAEEQRVFDGKPYESIYAEKTYDEVVGRFAATYRAHRASLSSSPVIADIGCGSADFGIRFVHAIGDVRFFALDIAINLLSRIDAASAARIHGDAFRLPFRDNSVDVLIAAAIIHHFPEYPLLLKEFHRVLAPQSLLLVFEPNGSSVKERVLYYAGRFFLRHVFTRNEFPISPFRLKAVLTSCGFSDIQMRPLAVSYRSGSKKSWAGKILHDFDKMRSNPFSAFPFFQLSCVCGKEEH